MSKQNILVRFGNTVRDIRKEKGLSQEKLAHKANLHRTYIGMIERAEKNDDEGNRIYKNLKAEYLEKYMPTPDADPHSTLDFKAVENPYCIDLPGDKLKSQIHKDDL